MKQVSLLFGASLLAMFTITPASAQEPEPALGEVVVTAQKREESLQRVPVAVSAISEEALSRTDAVRLDAVQTLAPSLHLGQTQAYFFTSIRGVGDTNFSIVSDPAVPFYVDGLYYPRANGPNAVLFDVDRVEVLRGPQGTLYGRNATGGVINVVPHQPGRELGGDASVQFGDYDSMRFAGALDLPLGSSVQTRVSGIYNKRDGFTKNLATTSGADRTIDRVDDLGLRAIVRVEASDDLTLRLVGGYFKGDGGSVPQKYLGPNPATPAYAGAAQNPTDQRLIYNDGRSSVDLEDVSGLAEAVLNVGFASWTTQVGYLDQSAHRLADIDGSALFIQNSDALVDTRLVTVESRLAGERGRLRWLAGLFYLDEDGKNVIAATSPGGPFLRINDARNNAAAVFGEGTYSLSEKTRLILGVRHTRDDKEGTSITLQQPGNPPNPPPRASDRSFQRTTWRVGAEHSITDRNLLYATVSSGYKAGGFNFVEGTLYRPESLTSYEIGAKNVLQDHKLVLNLAAFYYDYKNLQVNQLVPPEPPATIGTVQVTNAASTRTHGAELEFNWAPLERLNISGFAAYLDAKFRRFSNDDSKIRGTLFEDLSGHRPAFSPQWSFSTSVSYRFDFPGGYDLTPQLSEYWQDDSYLREFNRGEELVRSYFKTDASLELSAPDDRWSLSAFVTNLEDNDVLNYVAVGSPTVGFRFAGTYNPPRSYGVRFRVNF